MNQNQTPYQPPPPGWQPPPGYYPPPQPPKKKLGAGGIIAIILAALILVGAAAAAVYFLVLNKNKGPQPTLPTETEATETTPVETTAPTETEPEPTEPEETDDDGPSLSGFAERLATLDAYEMQLLGSNPVYYYQHPNLDLAIDLRGDELAARKMYVEVTPTGFIVTHRQSITYEYGSLLDYPGGQELFGNTVNVDLYSRQDYESIKSASVEFLPWGDRYVGVADSILKDPDESVVIAQALYDDDLYFDRFYLLDRLVRSEEAPIIREPQVDAAAEWAEMVAILLDNPAEFEYRYVMPPYFADTSAKAFPNWDILELLTTQPVYEYGSFDFDGDGVDEHFVHVIADSYDYVELYGYWAVFAETEAGLRLIDFVSSGESDLIYANDHFYHFSARGEYGEYAFIAEEHSTPVVSADQRTAYFVNFISIDVLAALQDEGESLDAFRDMVVIPKMFALADGSEYLDYYVIDTDDYFGLMTALDETLSGVATLIPIRTPYDGSPLGVALPSLDVLNLDDVMAYLDGEYSIFPFTENDWINAVKMSDILDQGPPLTHDTIDNLLPRPDLAFP